MFQHAALSSTQKKRAQKQEIGKKHTGSVVDAM
jgi:hypothetical protein